MKNLSHYKITNIKPKANSQRSYGEFENICPVAELGCVLAIKDERRFWELCVTKDHEYCSHLDEIAAGGAMESPLALLFGGDS